MVAHPKKKQRDLFSIKPQVRGFDKNKHGKGKINKKNSKFGRKTEKTKSSNNTTANLTPLSYQNITAGQVILGCIYKVSDYTLYVGLPHGLVGTVPITKICKSYSSLLQKVAEHGEDGVAGEEAHTLPELFTPGQYVVTCVSTVETVGNKVTLHLSLMPQDVNDGILATFLHEGYVLSCAVASVEDSGYIMDTGINSIRGAFLPHTETDGANILGVGSIVRCLVSEVGGNEDEGLLSLTLSANAESVKAAVLPLEHTENLSLLAPGTAVKTTVSKVLKFGVSVMLAGVDGVVSKLHLRDHLDTLEGHKPGDTVTARVLYVTPIEKVVHFTLASEVLGDSIISEDGTIHGIKLGDVIESAKVYENKMCRVLLRLSERCRGLCTGKRLGDGKHPTKHIERNFAEGLEKRVRVLSYAFMDNMFLVSAQRSLLAEQLLDYSEVKVGAVLDGRVKEFKSNGGVVVTLSKTVNGFIPPLWLSDKHLDDPQKRFPPGTFLPCRVLKVSPEEKKMVLTAKKSLVKSREPIITENEPGLNGMTTECCIIKVLPKNLVVEFYNFVKGIVPREFANVIDDAPLSTMYQAGQVVKCRVLEVKKANIIVSVLPPEYEMKYEEHSAQKKDETPDTTGESKECPADATDTNVEQETNKTESESQEDSKGKKKKKRKRNKSEAEKETQEMTEKETQETNKSEEVESSPEKEQKKKKRKKNKTTEESQPVDEENKEVSNDTKEAENDITENEASPKKKLKLDAVNTDEQISQSEQDAKQAASPSPKKTKEKKKKKKKVEENDSEDEEDSGQSKGAKQCLSVSSGFVWDVPDNQTAEASSESDDEDEEITKKKAQKLSRAEREALAKQEERRLHELETARLDKGRLPTTALDYEELLQTNPNSSALWIQFISFHLESAEVDKAKAVARRGLQMIDVREEEERLNVWTVVLRLEVLYGTDDSLDAAYKEALATNDQFKVYQAMAMVYAENDKMEEAEKIYHTLSKKFSQSPEVWLKAGIFFFKHNKAGKARSYMDRALLSLEKKHHVDLINRFGQLEFKFGDAERGKTMFESLLKNYPKRSDIWSVYVDITTKRGDIQEARKLLERMTGLKLRLRKMRFVFKKFLDFEKQHGTARTVEAIRRRVEDFVSAAVKQDSQDS